MFDSYKAGKQIVLLRKSRGITQEELAQRLSVSPQAVSKWENGHTMPEISVLVELSQILGATIDEILLPTGSVPINANFEHVLLPYEEIADFSGNGRTLKGISFLDGDDDKNSVMSFKQLSDFPGWYKKRARLILIGPSADKMSVEAACKEALLEGHRLLSNEIHQFEEPLVGNGVVIYDNWRNELKLENEKNLETIECLYPHIFIHYENKMRTKQFLELCIHAVTGIDREALETAISKYGELIAICEKAMNDWLTESPKDLAAARSVRQGFDWVLRRSKGLEKEALDSWALAIK